MYFIDRAKIDSTLTYMDEILNQFKSQHTFSSSIEKLGLERIVHMWIEAFIDVGNMMIDGFIMRDPGSYEDIIDILVDEQVLKGQDSDVYKTVVKLRSILLREYISLNHDEISRKFSESVSVLSTYSSSVRKYVNEELGPVHAFKNSDQS
ncbi:DUF86 domain-containing protein [Bacillaceae bacterium S4-13-58]